MNRLLGTRAYCAGPIDRCPQGGAHWRQQLKPLLAERGIITLDPLDKPVDVGLEDDDHRAERSLWKQRGEYARFAAVMRVVRAVDLRLVDLADFLIVYLDMDVQMCGTMEEIFLSNRQKKPCLIWCPQGRVNIPDWLYGTLNFEMFFETLDEVITYLDHVATAPEVDSHRRWMFLDYLKLYSGLDVRHPENP